MAEITDFSVLDENFDCDGYICCNNCNCIKCERCDECENCINCNRCVKCKDCKCCYGIKNAKDKEYWYFYKGDYYVNKSKQYITFDEQSIINAIEDKILTIP